MVFIRKLLLWSCVIFAAIIVIVYFGMLTYGRHIIQEQLTQKSLLQTTFVYDQHDEPVVALYVENRQPVRITDVPEQLQQAFIAI